MLDGNVKAVIELKGTNTQDLDRGLSRRSALRPFRGGDFGGGGSVTVWYNEYMEEKS